MTKSPSFTSFTLLCYLLRPLAWLLKPFAKTIIVATPASAGSLGDQALLQPIQDTLQRRGWSLRQLLLAGMQPIPLQYACGQPLVIHPNSRAGDLRFILAMLLAKRYLILGADVFDGRYDARQSCTYLKLARMAETMGKPVRFIGFSFSRNPAPAVTELLQVPYRKAEFFLRDPDSHERFLQHYRGPGKHDSVADNAFNLQPNLTAESARKFFKWRAQLPLDTLLLGVNINKLTVPEQYQELLDTLTLTLNSALETYPHLHVVMLPHDFRRGQSDLQSAIDLLNQVKPEFRDRIYVPGDDLNAWDIKAMCSGVDCVLTGRMHLAIAAMGSGKPVMAITYADKFEGLFRLFGLESGHAELLLPPQAALADSGANLFRSLEYLLCNKDAIAALINQALPKVKQLSARNLDGI